MATDTDELGTPQDFATLAATLTRIRWEEAPGASARWEVARAAVLGELVARAALATAQRRLEVLEAAAREALALAHYLHALPPLHAWRLTPCARVFQTTKDLARLSAQIGNP